MVAPRLMKCDSCDGCGALTDDAFRIPWTWHTPTLPGMAEYYAKYPVGKRTCNKCNGSGRIPGYKRAMPRNRRKRR